MSFGHATQMYPMPMLERACIPRYTIYALILMVIRSLSSDLSVRFDRCVVDEPKLLSQQKEGFGRVPAVNQDPTYRCWFRMYEVLKHLMRMLMFALAIMVWLKNTKVHDPEPIYLGVDVHTCHQAYAIYNFLLVSTPLPTYELIMPSMLLAQNRIVKQNIRILRWDDISPHCSPDCPTGQFVIAHIAIDSVVTQTFDNAR